MEWNRVRKSPKIWCILVKSYVGAKNLNEIGCKNSQKFGAILLKSNVGAKNWNEIGCKFVLWVFDTKYDFN